MKKKVTFDAFKKNALQNEQIRSQYEKLKPEFEFINQLIIARKKSNMSQADLAKRLHTKQPSIARFENGGFNKASISTIKDYANALGFDLKIRLIKKVQSSSRL